MQGRFFDMNVEKVLDNWDVTYACREYISNALDEHALLNINHPPEINLQGDVLTIRDYGRGLMEEHFVIKQNPEKYKSNKTIGQFGYGINDASAWLISRDHDVCIKTNKNRYTFLLKGKSCEESIKTYHVRIIPEFNNFQGTEIKISSITPNDFIRIKSLFLQFNNQEPLFKCDFGEVYEPENVPCIYVQGLKVSEDEQLTFSYNILKKDKPIRDAMSRERNNITRTSYTNRIKSILLKADGNFLEIIKTIYKNEQNVPLKDDLKWKDIRKFMDMKLKEEGISNIYVTVEETINNSDMIDEMKRGGKQIKIVHEVEKQELIECSRGTNHIVETMDNFISDSKTGFDKIIDIKDLNESELRIFNISTDFVDVLIGKLFNRKYEIYIAENLVCRNCGVLGYYDTKDMKIYMHRDCLKSLRTTLGTIIHEYAHAESGYTDVTRDFELILTDYLGHLAEIMCQHASS